MAGLERPDEGPDVHDLTLGSRTPDADGAAELPGPCVGPAGASEATCSEAVSLVETEAHRRLAAIFAKIDPYNGSVERAVNCCAHDPELWLKFFHRARDARADPALRGLRLVIARATELHFSADRLKGEGSAVSQKDESRVGPADLSAAVAGATGPASKSLRDFVYGDVSRRENFALEDTAGMGVSAGERPAADAASTTMVPSGWPCVSPRAMPVEVWEMDCLEAQSILTRDRGRNAAVLNLASPRRPGGGWRNGAGAQEENLFRRSDYSLHLERPEVAARYPLAEFGGIYSAGVRVFRSSEATGYSFLEEPVRVDFVAVGAYRAPRLIQRMGGDTRADRDAEPRGKSSSRGRSKPKKLSKHARRKLAEQQREAAKAEARQAANASDDDDAEVRRAGRKRLAQVDKPLKGTSLRLPDRLAEGTKNKIRAMLNIALFHGHDAIVLGAFGCGAYGCPPYHVALLFRSVLENEYYGAFREVVFAIIQDSNAFKAHNPSGNVAPFERVFSTWKAQL